MKIYKEIDINLDLYRANFNKPIFRYSEEEIKKLSCLYDMFQNGSFNAAIEFTHKWSYEERQLIPCEIYDILFDIEMGARFKFEQ